MFNSDKYPSVTLLHKSKQLLFRTIAFFQKKFSFFRHLSTKEIVNEILSDSPSIEVHVGFSTIPFWTGSMLKDFVDIIIRYSIIAIQFSTRKLHTGSRSTFNFTSRVNLSGPSLYCIARTLGE